MRKSIIVSIVAALAAVSASACVSEGPTHNRYVFSVFSRNAITDGPAYLYDIDSYWRQYAGAGAQQGTSYYKYNSDQVEEAARRKGDREMTAYLTQLNRYIGMSDDYYTYSWVYPSKEEAAQRRQVLLSVLAAAKAYRGTRLRAHYTLLQMRVNMMLGYNKANIALWNSAAKALQPSAWREAMRNIYARALLKTGQRVRACDIYAEQGDMQSISVVMDRYRNLAGIKSEYERNPNAPTLVYLVQDFVNNVQETIDQKPASKDDEEWLKEIDARAVYRQDAMQFVQMARRAADNPKVQNPSLWLAAACMTYYLLGNQQRADEESRLAVKAHGTPRMQDNARAIRLLVSTRSNRPTRQYTDWLLGEMKWLDGKIAEGLDRDYPYGNHYYDVKDRVVHKGLEPLMRSAGRDNAALALCAMMSAQTNGILYAAYDAEGAACRDYNMSYSPQDEYFCKMDSLTADRLASYYGYISSPHDDAFEQYCATHSYRSADYFNDLIGTKLIAEGRFADAMPYLRKVSLDFLSTQNISPYAAKRSYVVPRWFAKQQVDDTDEPVKVARNIKLDFCRDMAELKSQYALARDGDARRQTAYDLAVRYFQASCYGDCWFLTHYYRSVADSARSWEHDFAAETSQLLAVAKRSDNAALRYHAIYALAFVPADPWYTVGYDSDYNEVAIVRPQSAQYAALGELSLFARACPDAIDDYVRRCDVLRRFALQAIYTDNIQR